MQKKKKKTMLQISQKGFFLKVFHFSQWSNYLWWGRGGDDSVEQGGFLG